MQPELPFSTRLQSLFRIAFPVLLQSLVGYIMVFTDQAFISQYRIDGLSALNNAMAPYFMLMSFFMALSQGATILISQALGAGRPARARRIAENSFFFNQLVCLAYFLFWEFGARGVLTVVGARGEILEMGVTYVSTLAVVYLWTGAAAAAASIFQGKGKTTPLMISAIVKSLLNILFDWILIFGHWGFPALGVFGAALATVLADLIGSVLLIVMALRLRDFPLNWNDLRRPQARVYFQVLKIGIPAGLEFSLWSGGQVVLIAMLNQVGPLTAGFYGLLTTLTNFSVNIYIGLGVAAMTLVGKATGARTPREALFWGNLAAFLTLLVCLGTGALYLLFPVEILQLFNSDSQFISLFLGLIGLVVATTFPKGINIVIGSAIRGTGNTKWMLYTQVFGTVFIVSSAWGLIFGLGWGLLGLVWANFLDELLRAVMNWAKFLWPYRRYFMVTKKT